MRNLMITVALLISLIGMLFRCAERTAIPVTETLDYAVQKYIQTALDLDPSAGLPRTTDADGKWIQKLPGDWTNGFYPGILWYLYEYSQDEKMRSLAETWTSQLEQLQYETRHHDVGFQIFCSYGNGYRITGDDAYKDVIIRAAQSLATRYNPVVGAIKSWSWNPDPPLWTYPVIIDNMMNLELLLWSAKNGGEEKFADIATSHAIVTSMSNVREDGSVFHVADFDPESGKFVKGVTWQGYSHSSVWARGQAWALYGYTMVYRETGDKQFLKIARELADFFISNLPEDAIPYWDFRTPDIPNTNRDASAAAIAASGLIELSTFSSEPQLKQKYMTAAEKILATLCSQDYLTKGVDNDALLLHSVGSMPESKEVDVPLIYADYYFIEALLRYKSIK